MFPFRKIKASYVWKDDSLNFPCACTHKQGGIADPRNSNPEASQGWGEWIFPRISPQTAPKNLYDQIQSKCHGEVILIKMFLIYRDFNIMAFLL